MAQINNSDLKKALIDGAKINIVVDDVPAELGKTVVPVLDVSPRTNRVCNVVGDKDSAGTIYTTPSDRDFYLTNVSVSCAFQDAAANKNGGVKITAFFPDNSAAKNIIQVKAATSNITDAVSNALAYNLFVPIKLKRNSVIALAQVGANNPTAQTGHIVGYTVED